MSSRYSKFREQIRENGLAATVARNIERRANDYAPPWLLRFRRIRVAGMVGPAPQRIPSLSGVSSRCVTAQEAHELDAVFPGSSQHHEFFRNGSICAVAIADGKICALAWARPGPGDCVVDDNIRLGFRWGLEAGEAWLHNGEALGDARGSGVYLTAFRGLMEEMVKRGVGRCYALVSEGNAESLRTHRRLGLKELASLRYTRVGGVGRYYWQTPTASGDGWTLQRSFRVCPASFFPQPKA